MVKRKRLHWNLFHVANISWISGDKGHNYWAENAQMWCHKEKFKREKHSKNNYMTLLYLFKNTIVEWQYCLWVCAGGVKTDVIHGIFLHLDLQIKTKIPKNRISVSLILSFWHLKGNMHEVLFFQRKNWFIYLLYICVYQLAKQQQQDDEVRTILLLRNRIMFLSVFVWRALQSLILVSKKLQQQVT